MNNTSLALVVVVGDLPCSRTWHTSGRPLADFWQTSIGGVLPHAPTHPPADLRQTSIGGVLPHAPTPLGRPPADLRQTSSRPPADLQQIRSPRTFHHLRRPRGLFSVLLGYVSQPQQVSQPLQDFRPLVPCGRSFLASAGLLRPSYHVVVRTHQFCLGL